MRKNHLFLCGILLALAASPSTAQQRTQMALKSAAFADGAAIPAVFTCTGEDRSPPLAWTNIPAKAKSLDIVVKDPDAPGGTFVHWVLYNVSVGTSGLGANVPKKSTVLDGAEQGVNGFGKLGYGGPCPPPGSPHHYHFVLYALDRRLDLQPGADAEGLERAAQGHVLATAELIGVFQR